MSNVEIDFKSINKDYLKFLKNVKEKDLETVLRIASDSYYSSSKELLNDYVFDKLKDYLEDNYPKNKFLLEIGAPIIDKKDKIELPYFMGSMNKKKTEKDIERWIKSYPNDIIISDKLDGVSFLLCIDNIKSNHNIKLNHNIKSNHNIKLYTRGNGIEGKDISKLLEYLQHNLPKLNDKLNDKLVLRGEMIISKNNYKNIHEKSSNPRSFISGISNLKEIKGTKKDYMKYVDLVCYEVIEPKLKPEEQFKLINKLGFKCVDFKKKNKLEYLELEKYLIERKEKSEYEVDGIIVTENKIHIRKEENPKHSFAYKKDLEFAITTVLGIEWNISKYGKLKPIVKIEKVNLLGTDNIKCTGNNADFIVKNKIGKGAIIKIIKGGEIIPKIEEVLKPAEKGELPEDIEYKWNETHKEIIIKDFDLKELKLKKIITFFKEIGIENIGKGIYTKLYNNGFDSIEKICKITKTDLIKMDGIKEKSSENIYNNIHLIIEKEIDIIKIIIGSCIYEGLGEKILVKILDKYPDLFIKKINSITIEDLNEIESIQTKTSNKILFYLDDIKQFIEELHYLKIKNYVKKIKIKSKKNKKLFNNMNIAITGFRDKDILYFIENNLGKIQNTINNKTNLLIYKDLKSKKIEKAKELNKEIISLDEFRDKYKLLK